MDKLAGEGHKKLNRILDPNNAGLQVRKNESLTGYQRGLLLQLKKCKEGITNQKRTWKNLLKLTGANPYGLGGVNLTTMDAPVQ